jgi:hypothetical protein
MKVILDPVAKLPKLGEAPTAAEHPNPRYRRMKEGQHFTRVDPKTGEHTPPRGGLLATAPAGKPWPKEAKRREEAGERHTVQSQKDAIIESLRKHSERRRGGG